MKKLICKIIVAVMLLATIISIPPTSAKASVKLEEDNKWFYTNSHYTKSISIPLDYYNYNAEYDYEQDYRKYTSYYLYDTIMLPNDLPNLNKNNLRINDMSFKLEYDKSIITIKKIEKKNGTALAIKPLKKGSTNLKITVSAKGYYPYKITTKINILDKGKLISTKTALNTYFTNTERSKKGYQFVPDVIKELNLKNKSLYEKVLYTSKWCIDNYDDLKTLYYKNNPRYSDSDNYFKRYMNNLFIEYMKELNIPYDNFSYTIYTFVLMNDDKWYMVDINNATYSTVKDIEFEIQETLDDIEYYQEEWENEKKIETYEDRFFDDDYYKKMINNAQEKSNELNEKLKLVKSGIPVDLTHIMVSPFVVKSFSSDFKPLGKELAKDDLQKDPDNTQIEYLGKLPQFTERKITINLLNSYNKLVKLPLALNGIKSDDIEILERVFFTDLVAGGEQKKKDVYITTGYGRQSGNVIIEATAGSSTLFDTMEVEVICPTIDGQQRITINNVKNGSKIKIPLADAKFSDFNIKSENTKIATVSVGGVITAKSKGQTTIILESKSNSKFILEVNIGVEKEYNYFQW